MRDRYFLDSNILLYAFDASAGEKSERAADCLRRLWRDATGAVSMQVLQEFYVNATQKLETPLPRKRARDIIAEFVYWDPVRPDLTMLLRASALAERRKLSFWDALIVISAQEAGASTLYTEDLSPGSTIEGVRIVNPLAG